MQLAPPLDMTFKVSPGLLRPSAPARRATVRPALCGLQGQHHVPVRDARIGVDRPRQSKPQPFMEARRMDLRAQSCLRQPWHLRQHGHCGTDQRRANTGPARLGQYTDRPDLAGLTLNQQARRANRGVSLNARRCTASPSGSSIPSAPLTP